MMTFDLTGLLIEMDYRDVRTVENARVQARTDDPATVNSESKFGLIHPKTWRQEVAKGSQ